MSAARLLAFSEQLCVSVPKFFEDLEAHPEMPEDVVYLLRKPRGLQLLRLFDEITTEALQDVVVNLAATPRDTTGTATENDQLQRRAVGR